MTNLIKFSQVKNTGIVTLNRPEAMNAINIEMIAEIKENLYVWENKSEIKNIVIKGEGKAFCAGGDIKAICLLKKESPIRRKFFKNEYELNYFLNSYSKPIVSIWNGVVMGGGVGISLYGKYRIATEKTKFAMPESAIGFFPDCGTSYVLSRIKKSIGLFIGLTGYVLNYTEAYKLDLANYFISEKNISHFLKNFIDQGIINDEMNDDIHYSNSEILDNIELIEKNFSSFDIKIIFENLKKDKSSFSKKTLKHLLTRCPTSLAITCKNFKKARKMSLKECLDIDYKLSQIMINRSDFINGVTEVLINKNKNTKWSPDSVKKIDETINNYLTFLDK